MQEDESLQTRNGDAKVGLDAEGTLKELVMLRPVRRHELFDEQLLGGRVVDLMVDGPVVQVAKGAKSEDKIEAAEEAGIVVDERIGSSCHLTLIQVVESLVKVAACKDGTMNIEAAKVDVDNSGDHFAVFGKPDIYRVGELWGDGRDMGRMRKCVGAAADGDGDPVGGIAGNGGLGKGTVAARGQSRRTDSKVFFVDLVRADNRNNVCRHPEIFRQCARVTHVIAIGILSFDVCGEGADGSRRGRTVGGIRLLERRMDVGIEGTWGRRRDRIAMLVDNWGIRSGVLRGIWPV